MTAPWIQNFDKSTKMPLALHTPCLLAWTWSSGDQTAILCSSWYNQSDSQVSMETERETLRWKSIVLTIKPWLYFNNCRSF